MPPVRMRLMNAGLLRRRRDARAQQRISLIAQPDAEGLTEHTSYTHLIQGDLAPVGRVHLVSMRDAGDQRTQHILSEMDADANMGARRLAERSRKGPFKTETGRSRVMGQSRHVSYRRRGNNIEITVRRGVTDQEMERLIHKLSAHRMSTTGSLLYIIASSKKKMGALDQIDMEKLRLKIYDLLLKRATIGILVVDAEQRGSLHKGFSYSRKAQEDNARIFGGALFKK